jgi:predicted ATPase/transcriptional regulator with XRE-family HTH domain
MGLGQSARSLSLVKSLTVVSDDDMENLEFAALLKRFRVKAGLSQQALADRALVSVQAVSALERGYRKAPYRKTLDRLVDALGLSERARDALEIAARRARGSAVAEQQATRVHNLPRQLTSFVGRDEVVNEIAGFVTTAPLVSIVGTGGVGKTRAAIEVGAQLLNQFTDGVWFVQLAPLNDPELVTHALAAALGVQESPRRSLLSTLISYLERKQLLIILDNCEHVIAQTRGVAGSVLRDCPNVSVLVTSREPLTIAGESVYWMPPLAFPSQEGIPPHEVMSYGAVTLFADRARAADTRFAVTQENVEAVVEICRRLDGLPLAIELAAARAIVLSPWQICERLDRVFDLLTANGHAAFPRHETMRAVIDWSYTLLSSHTRLLFDRLSIFAGGFALESAIDVCNDDALPGDDVLELLSSLVSRSLVTVDCSRGYARYRLLESTRQYALEKLVERGEQKTLSQRHTMACLHLAERLDRDWYTAYERVWFQEAEAELDNCRAALRWSMLEGNDLETGRRLAGALARVWYSLSPVEGRQWVRLALESVGVQTPPPVAAQLFIADAELCGSLGEYKASLASAERAIAALAQLDDELQMARARKVAGSALGALDRGAESEVLLEEALANARSLDNHRLRAVVLGDLGTTRSRRGDIDGARRFYAEALASFVSLGLERPAASIAGHLAEVEFAAGDAGAALHRAQEARNGHEATHNRRSIANDLSNMAAYLVALNCYDDARVHASQALATAREVKATVLTAFALQHVAAVGALRECSDEHGAEDSRERAAMLLGFVDARLASLEARREYTERQEYERMLQALNAAFGSGRLDELMALGAEWTEDGAVAVAVEA